MTLLSVVFFEILEEKFFWLKFLKIFFGDQPIQNDHISAPVTLLMVKTE